jgi:hypothetical protein
MARSLAYVSLFGGVVALPFLDDLLDVGEKFFGTPVRSNMRKTLRDFGGPVMERMGMAGIPALMGIDISGSLKMGLPFTSLAGGQGTPADTVYGVYAGLGKKGLNAMSAAEREDYLRALEFASPAFIEAALKAYRMADQGATTARGKVLTDERGKPIRLGTGEGRRPSCWLPPGATGAGFPRALDDGERPEQLQGTPGRALCPLPPGENPGGKAEGHPGHAAVQHGRTEISGSHSPDHDDFFEAVGFTETGEALFGFR